MGCCSCPPRAPGWPAKSAPTRELNFGGASQERATCVSDGRQQEEAGRLPRVGALVRSQLGKIGWAWKKNKGRGGKLKFERFWFLESEGKKLVQNAFFLQECAECLNSLSCPQSPQSPEHSKCQRGKWEQNGPQELRVHSSFTTLQASTALSYATQPSCLLPQTQQKARYGNIRAFDMQGLLHGESEGGDHTSPQSHKPTARTLQCQLPGSWLTNNMANC